MFGCSLDRSFRAEHVKLRTKTRIKETDTDEKIRDNIPKHMDRKYQHLPTCL